MKIFSYVSESRVYPDIGFSGREALYTHAHARVFSDSDSAVFGEKCRPANRGTLPRGPRISGHSPVAIAALGLFVVPSIFFYLPFNIERCIFQGISKY